MQRVAEMAKQVFGCDPLVLPLPYKETLTSSEAVGFTTIIAGCNPRISTAFRDRGKFWLNSIPPENLAVDGFDKPQEKAKDKATTQRGDWVPLAPAKLVVDNEGARQSTSDDWPFLYVSGRLIPDLTVRSMILLGVLGLLGLLAVLTRAGFKDVPVGKLLSIDPPSDPKPAPPPGTPDVKQQEVDVVITDATPSPSDEPTPNESKEPS